MPGGWGGGGGSIADGLPTGAAGSAVREPDALLESWGISSPPVSSARSGLAFAPGFDAGFTIAGVEGAEVSGKERGVSVSADTSSRVAVDALASGRTEDEFFSRAGVVAVAEPVTVADVGPLLVTPSSAGIGCGASGDGTCSLGAVAGGGFGVGD